jgi:hypothetical protein
MGICLENLGKVQEAIELYKKKLVIAQQTGENWPIRAQYSEFFNFDRFW